MKRKRHILGIVCTLVSFTSVFAGDYTTFFVSERGFHEVTSMDGIVPGSDECYILGSAEDRRFLVGVGSYEAKPDWASELSKALRYYEWNERSVLDLSSYFTIEKRGNRIGFRNVVYSADLFQTHNNAGYMYVNTYTEKSLDEWSELTPTFANGYWIFESGKYPMSSGDWACGYLGPWNKTVAAGEAIALNRKNTADDAAGHYRLYRISRSDLLALKRLELTDASETDGRDATWLVKNASFETGDETGWTLRGKDANGNDEFKTRDYGMSGKDGGYLMNAWQWWSSLLSVGQKVENVPSGIYEVSAVLATWEGREVSFSVNDWKTTESGLGDGTGIRVGTTIHVGNDERIDINAGSRGLWWIEGHEGEDRTFFKLDDVRLTCKGLFLNAYALPLPNDESTLLSAGQWYYHDIDYGSEYWLTGEIEGMVCSADADKRLEDISTCGVERSMTFNRGRVFFKTERSDATLRIERGRNTQQGTFTAVALNVDGLPNTILGVIEVNKDGPGSDGTKKISQYLASKGYDLIGCSEDFNYHGSLMSALENAYSSGTVRATLNLWDLSYPFDTDGLNLIWKESTMSAENETWTRWTATENTEGNQYVKKGFRHYDITTDNHVFDLYVLHMDAGDIEATWSRHSQWEQLAGAINSADPTRPKLIIGDTNSRWTREDINAHFTALLSSNLTMSDVWVELCRGNEYPNTFMDNLTDDSDGTDYSKYEVVDKIIYINPKAPNTMQLHPESFRIEQDYTYGTVEGTNNTTALGDHKPVVVTFTYTYPTDPAPLEIVLNDDADNDATLAHANGALANVTLAGRTLVHDNNWNTICLPFSVDLTDADCPLKGAMVKALSEARMTGYHVDLAFGENVSMMEAGTPYIIKWVDGENTANPVFQGVTIVNSSESDRTVNMADGHVKFIGYYSPFTINPTDHADIYYMTSGSSLKRTAKERTLKALRAYFQFSPNPGEGVSNAFVARIDFGDGSTATGIASAIEEHTMSEGVWYTLNGEKLAGQATQKGVYIKDRRKVVVR